MIRIVRFGFLVELLLVSCGHTEVAARDNGLRVSLAHGAEAEAQTGERLRALAALPGVGRWIHTREIRVDELAIPHSHPMLTIHTRHLGEDDLLLSTFLHEQIHWYLAERPRATDAAVAELRSLFPDPPVGFPDGAATLLSSYEHLIVNHLELMALREAIGSARASAVFNRWRDDHYRALYTLVLTRETEIADILARHGLSHRDGAGASAR